MFLWLLQDLHYTSLTYLSLSSSDIYHFMYITRIFQQFTSFFTTLDLCDVVVIHLILHTFLKTHNSLWIFLLWKANFHLKRFQRKKAFTFTHIVTTPSAVYSFMQIQISSGIIFLPSKGIPFTFLWRSAGNEIFSFWNCFFFTFLYQL